MSIRAVCRRTQPTDTSSARPAPINGPSELWPKMRSARCPSCSGRDESGPGHESRATLRLDPNAPLPHHRRGHTIPSCERDFHDSTGAPSCHVGQVDCRYSRACPCSRSETKSTAPAAHRQGAGNALALGSHRSGFRTSCTHRNRAPPRIVASESCR